MKKIWIDTDIGGDIDDALALLLVTGSENVRLLGVSTVFENAVARAKIAAFLLEKGGLCNVPVYAGNGLPIKARSVFGTPVDEKKLPKTYLKEKFDGIGITRGDAVEAIKNAVENNEGMTVVSIGALTNLANFIEKYPETAHKADYVIMGAAKSLNLNEFNLTCDPEASAKVFSSDVKKKIVTLDCTFRCEVPEDKKKRLRALKSTAVSTVMDMFGKWGETMILHDPLAVSAAIGNEYLTFEKGDLLVETAGEFSRGKCVDLTDFNWRKPGRDDMLVSVDVDAEAFVEHFVSTVEKLDEKLLKQ